MQPSKRTTCLSPGVSEPWLVGFHATTSPRASWCPQPIQIFNSSLHSLKVPAGFQSSLPPTLWRGFEPVKAKTMQNGPSSTTHDPVMKREEYRWRGWWERAGGRQRRRVDSRDLACGKWNSGIRCGAHANHVPLFSPAGVRDSLTKTQQMDQAGLWLPQKKCAVMKTTFLHTKALCSCGHAWLHVRRGPFLPLCCTQSHTPAHAQLVYCSDWIIQLFLTVYPSFYSASIFAPKRIFAYLPSYSRIFVTEFREWGTHAKWFPLIPDALRSSAVKGFCSSDSHGVSHFIICTTAL